MFQIIQSKAGLSCFMRHVVFMFMLLFPFFTFSNSAKSTEADSLNLALKSNLDYISKLDGLYRQCVRHYARSDFDIASSIALQGEQFALEMLKKNNSVEIKKRLAKFYFRLGIIYNDQSLFTRALEYYLKGLDLQRELGLQEYVVRTLNKVGLIYTVQANYAKALEYYYEGLKINEMMNYKPGIIKSYLDIGYVLFPLSEVAKAEEYFFKALKIAEELNDPNQIYAVYNSFGMLYGELGQYDKSLEYFQKFMNISKQLGDKKKISGAMGNIAQVYELQGKIDVAIDYYLESLKMDQHLKNLYGVSLSMTKIGRLYTKTGNYSKAKEYLRNALKIAIDLRATEGIAEAHYLLYELYEKSKEPQKALEHYKAYDVYMDSIYNNENTKNSLKAQMNYEYEKKQQEEKLVKEKREALYEEKTKRQEIIIYGTCLVVISLLVFSLLIVRSYKQKQKINKELDIRNQKLESAFKIIEDKKREITDSINYALRIQQSFLPEKDEIFSFLPDCFILFKPKDIVSGDFYYWRMRNDKALIAAADCTGHGVPGAMMSILGSEKIGAAVRKSGNVADILQKVNKGINRALHQSENQQAAKDGMDIALCGLTFNDDASVLLEFAGANRPLWIIKKDTTKIEEIKATKVALGGYTEYEQLFQKQEIRLEKGDTFYIFSDGYSDQFGGERGKKITTKKLKQLLLNIKDQPMKEQEKFLEGYIEEWKITEEQVDDILFIGIRV